MGRPGGRPPTGGGRPAGPAAGARTGAGEQSKAQPGVANRAAAPAADRALALGGIRAVTAVLSVAFRALSFDLNDRCPGARRGESTGILHRWFRDRQSRHSPPFDHGLLPMREHPSPDPASPLLTASPAALLASLARLSPSSAPPADPRPPIPAPDPREPRAEPRPERDSGLLARLVDLLSEGLLLCDGRGTVLHQNSAVTEVLDADGEAPRIREEIDVLTHSLNLLRLSRGAPGPGQINPCLTRTVRTAKASYRLRGAYLEDAQLKVEPTILVVLEPLVPRPFSDAELRERFHCTAREVQIIRLVGEGKATEAIAEALRISRHTVRRHVERALVKLGAHTRGELTGLVLRGEEEQP